MNVHQTMEVVHSCVLILWEAITATALVVSPLVQMAVLVLVSKKKLLCIEVFIAYIYY